MNEQQASSRKLAVGVRPRAGGSYSTFVLATPRDDDRWEGSLRFISDADSHTIDTPPQTTQRSAANVFFWATALSVAHIENAFTAAVAPRPDASPVRGAAPTPPDPETRLLHLGQIERDVLSVFRSRRTVRIAAREIFARGPHANADFVRAFEDLEKRWRYLLRRTIGGVDILDLTTEGAHALGLRTAPGDKARAEPPKSTGAS